MKRSLKNIRIFVSYDEKTGVFIWIKSPNSRAPKGSECGWVQDCNGKKYRCINFGGKAYLSHRLAWWWLHGKMPPPKIDIDHKNQNSLDNRIENLRLATRGQNNANGRHLKGIYRGVVKSAGRFVAQIRKDGAYHYLGRFHCPIEAATAYDKKAIELFGEYARPNFP